MKYHLTLDRMAIIRKSTNAGEGMDRREPSYIVGGKVGAPTVETSMEIPQKTNKQKKKTGMTTWSNNSTPVCLCRQNYHSKWYTPPAFTAALFTRAKTWPLADECIKNTWYINTMEHSLSHKSNNVTCSDMHAPEMIILSTSGREKQITHAITYTCI